MGSRLGCVQRGTGAAAPSPLCNPPYPARRTDTKRLQSTSTQAIILSTAAIPASPLQAHLSIGKEEAGFDGFQEKSLSVRLLTVAFH